MSILVLLIVNRVIKRKNMDTKNYNKVVKLLDTNSKLNFSIQNNIDISVFDEKNRERWFVSKRKLKDILLVKGLNKSHKIFFSKEHNKLYCSIS